MASPFSQTKYRRFWPKRGSYIWIIGGFVSYIGLIGNIGALAGLIYPKLMSKKYQLHTISIKSDNPNIDNEIIEVNYALCRLS